MLLHNIVKVAELIIENDEENKVVVIVTDNGEERNADYLLVDKSHGELRDTLNILNNGVFLVETADYNGWSLSKIDWE